MKNAIKFEADRYKSGGCTAGKKGPGSSRGISDKSAALEKDQEVSVQAVCSRRRSR